MNSLIRPDTENLVGLRAGLEHVDYFKSVPWCAAIINDPRYTISPTVTRQAKASGEDAFFAKTLKTDDTIVRLLTINTLPDESLHPAIQEVFVFFEVGSGVNGYPDTCHGGFVATMLDEAMGLVLNVVQLYENSKTGRHDDINYMTAYLNTSYLSPVRTPGIILATAKVIKEEGRKIWVNGTLEDSERNVLTKSESLYIQAKKDPRAGVKL
jgi:acyl-coenzyme A thioesterase PaaI-like protein